MPYNLSADHTVNTGDAVVYSSGGGAPIGGLVDGLLEPGSSTAIGLLVETNLQGGSAEDRAVVPVDAARKIDRHDRCIHLADEIGHAWDEPLEVIAMKAEGTFEYQALLFIPSHAPFDLFSREHRAGIHLYVKRAHVIARGLGDHNTLLDRLVAI